MNHKQYLQLWPALAAATITIVLLAIGSSQAWPLTLGVGERDARFVQLVTPDNNQQGFHAVETFDGRPARWTSNTASIDLPRPPDNRAATLTLRLLNSRPPDQPDPQVTLVVDGMNLATFAVPRTTGGPRSYTFLMPAGTQFRWATTIQIQSSTVTLPDDPRPLGVVVNEVTLTPLDTPWLPSIWVVLWSAALGGFAYLLPRNLGGGRAVGWASATIIAALVALGVALRPLEVLPFVQRIAALLGIACLGVGLARLLAPPQQSEQGGVRVRGADLPIYLAVAWWMGPLFQLAMTADGARNVTPAPTTMWLGGLTALLLLGVGGWRLLNRRSTSSTSAKSFPSSPHRFVTILGAILAVIALVHLGTMIQFAFTRSGPDFWILFRGTRDWARGGSLYDLNAVVTNHFGHVFKVPPFYGMLFTPFVFQDGLMILFFHRVLNVLLLATAVLVWMRMFGIPLFSALGAGIIILINFRPFADTIAFGQIDLALLLILTLALWALRAERNLLAGALIALGALFKIYPVLLLAFCVIKRRWLALLGFALGMLVLNGVALAVMGWEMHRVYLFEVLPRIGGSTAWVENQTIAGVLARLVAPPTEAAIFQDWGLALLANGIAAVVSLAACILALRPASPKPLPFTLQYSQFLLLMVFAAPAAWMHYETLLFVPFAALLLHWHTRDLSLAKAAALATSFALIAYGNQWSYYDGTVMGVLTIAGISYKFYGMLLLGSVLAATLLEKPAPATSSESVASTRERCPGAKGAPSPL
jgi:hypothetical protein